MQEDLSEYDEVETSDHGLTHYYLTRLSAGNGGRRINEESRGTVDELDDVVAVNGFDNYVPTGAVEVHTETPRIEEEEELNDSAITMRTQDIDTKTAHDTEQSRTAMKRSLQDSDDIVSTADCRPQRRRVY